MTVSLGNAGTRCPRYQSFEDLWQILTEALNPPELLLGQPYTL